MEDNDIVLMLLGQSVVDKYKNAKAIEILADRHNALVKENKILLEENELANKDAAQLRMRVDRILMELEKEAN